MGLPLIEKGENDRKGSCVAGEGTYNSPTFTFLQIDLERLSTNKKAHNVCKGTTKMLDEPEEWLKK